MNKYWFRQKRYGYGAYPTTIEGWALIAGFIVILVLDMKFFLYRSIVGYFSVIAIALAVLLYVSWKKTEGGWKWRWG